MALLTLPDGVRRRGIKVLYDMATGKFMVRGTVLNIWWLVLCAKAAPDIGCMLCMPLANVSLERAVCVMTNGSVHADWLCGCRAHVLWAYPSPWLITACPALQSVGLENEVFTSVDPEQAVNLSTLPPQLQAPGPPLSADPTGWLPDAASWHGSALRVHIAEAAAAGRKCFTSAECRFDTTAASAESLDYRSRIHLQPQTATLQHAPGLQHRVMQLQA
jgi:hypothetical protein